MAAHIFDNESPVLFYSVFQTCNDFLRFSILKHYTRKLKEITLQYYYAGKNFTNHLKTAKKSGIRYNEMRYH